MKTHFGPAGLSESLKKQTKSQNEVPKLLNQMGLTAFEYQCGRGVKVSKSTAEKFGENCSKYQIKVSLHAPYYISLSSIEEEKRLKSLDYILQSAQAVNSMGGNRIIVHSGSASKLSREQAVLFAKDTLQKAQVLLDGNNLQDIRICPETMGKQNQLGTLDEVLELCTVDERFLPCIDFGHLNARSLGGLKSYDDFKVIFDSIEQKLGIERLKNFHAHFSKIEYTVGGEKKHLTFEDQVYGPSFEPVAELILKKNSNPTVICESAGTQTEDAIIMRNILERVAR